MRERHRGVELTDISGAVYSAPFKKAETIARTTGMRKPNQITVDRALLLYVLHLAEPHGLLSDVKLQQLCFLCELQMFGKGFKGFHFEFFRFAYGAFSKDLDNDLMSLRRKERVENFTLSDQAQEEVIPLLEKGIEGVETNEKIVEILKAVVTVYGPQDSGTITQSVESVELSTPQQPEFEDPDPRYCLPYDDSWCRLASRCRRSSRCPPRVWLSSIRRWDISLSLAGC